MVRINYLKKNLLRKLKILKQLKSLKDYEFIDNKLHYYCLKSTDLIS